MAARLGGPLRCGRHLALGEEAEDSDLLIGTNGFQLREGFDDLVPLPGQSPEIDARPLLRNVQQPSAAPHEQVHGQVDHLPEDAHLLPA